MKIRGIFCKKSPTFTEQLFIYLTCSVQGPGNLVRGQLGPPWPQRTLLPPYPHQRTLGMSNVDPYHFYPDPGAK